MLYIADSSNNRIVRRQEDLNTFVDTIPKFTGMVNNFNTPTSVCSQNTLNRLFETQSGVDGANFDIYNKADKTTLAFISRVQQFGNYQCDVCDETAIYTGDISNLRCISYDFATDTLIGTKAAVSCYGVTVNKTRVYVGHNNAAGKVSICTKLMIEVDSIPVAYVRGLTLDLSFLYATIVDNITPFNGIRKYDLTTKALVLSLGGAAGNGDNQFNTPSSISTDGTYLYIADTGNNRIKKHLCSDLSFVAKQGSVGAGNNNYSSPLGIYTDKWWDLIFGPQGNINYALGGGKRLPSWYYFVRKSLNKTSGGSDI